MQKLASVYGGPNLKSKDLQETKVGASYSVEFNQCANF